MDEKGRRAKMLHTYIQTYIQTDRQTYRQTNRPSDEVGCRGAFAPTKIGNDNCTANIMITNECLISHQL